MGIQSLGVGSGIDLGGMLTQLMNLERQPIKTLERKVSSYNTQISNLGSLSSALSSFKTSVSDLTDTTLFQSSAAKSSDEKVLTATSTSSAIAGAYTVNVTALAKAQTLQSSSSMTDTQIADLGNAANDTIDFTVGGQTKTVTLSSANMSLAQVRDAINNASVGMTASIVKDTPTTSKLVFTASESGTAKVATQIKSSNLDKLGFLHYAAPAVLSNSSGNIDPSAILTGLGSNPPLPFTASAALSVTVAGTSYNIDLAGGSLNDIRDSINNDSALSGKVVASISNHKLLLQAKNSNDSIDSIVNNTGDTGLDFLTTLSPTTVSSMSQATAGADANVTVNGVSVTASGNSITDAVQGTTLSVLNTGSVTLTVGRDNDAINKKVQAFVDAYNKVVDASTKAGAKTTSTASTAAAMDQQLAQNGYAGNNGMSSISRSVISQLSSELFVAPNFSTSATVTQTATKTYGTLAEIGITRDKNGKLSFDSTTFQTALNTNLTNVKELFANNTSISGGQIGDGIMDRLGRVTYALTTSGGLIDSKTSSINSQIDATNSQKNALTLRVDALQARMTKQFNNLDVTLSQMQSQSSRLSASLSRLM